MIRVMLVDDHRLFREGLRNLLATRPDVQVVGEAQDGRDAVSLVAELEPDLVIMDVAMPGLNGVEATRQIRSQHRDRRVLALSMHSDWPYVTRMLEAGATGYVLKEAAFEELAAAMATVLAGEVYLSPALTSMVVDGYVRLASDRGSLERPTLTPREREVLQLVAEGRSTRVIAQDLGVSVKTIETHRRQIMDKLDLRSVAELTKYALREGITTL